MAYGAQYQVQHKVSPGGTELTFLVEVLKNGYSGGVTNLKGHRESGVFNLIYEGPDPERLRTNPVIKSRLELYFVVESSTELTILDNIFQSDDSEYRMRLSLDGSIMWEGPVVTDLVERPGDRWNRGTITAKDFTRLPSEDYALATGRDTIVTVLADLLSTEGLGYDLKTIPSFSNKNTSDSDDWMNQISLDKKRIRNFARSDDEDDQEYDKWTVLNTLARNFQTIIFQSGGNWYAIQLTGDANDPATIYTYNTAGSQQSKTSVDLDAAVDRSNRWLQSQTQHIGTPGIKRVNVDFAHESRSQIQPIPDRVVVTSGDANKDFEVIPFFSSDGTQKISFDCGVEADGTGDETRVTARIEFRVGDTDNFYYLDNSGESLSWETSQTYYEIELGGFNVDPNGPGIDDDDTIDSSGLWFNNRVSIPSDRVPAIPPGADGSIRVRFAAAIDHQSPANLLSETRYFNVNFSLKNDTVEADSRSLSYKITQDGDYSGVYDLGETWFGDGPASFSVSSLTYESGGKNVPTNDDWRRVGGTAELKFHNVLGREIIDTQRTSTEIIRAQLLGSYRPHQVLTTDSGSNRYFFIGGRLSGADAIWQADFLNINVDTDGDRSIGVIIDDPDDSTGGGGGGGGNGEDPKAIGELTADVSSTTATSLPVNVYVGKAIESGKDYFIWHLAKQRPISFTALEDLDSGDATLTIEEQVVVAPDESKIYKEEGQKETERLIQVEQQTATESARASLSLSVKNERQDTAIGTTTSELSGTITSVPLENIPFEIKLEDGDTLTLLDVVDDNEGANEDVTVNGNQTLTAGTGTVTVNSVALSNTYPVGSTLFEPAAGLTSRISLVSEVTTSNSSSIASLETDVSALESTLVLKAEVTSGNITKLAFVQLDASAASGSSITLSADEIFINGVTFDDDGVMYSSNFDGGITSGTVDGIGTIGWAMDRDGNLYANSATLRDGDIIDPNFSGSAVGLINTVATKADLPATGESDGDTYFVADEPGGLYVWDDSSSSWDNTRDGQFILASTIVAGKLNVAKLSAITASMGLLNVTDTITMSSGGEILQSDGAGGYEWRINPSGFDVTADSSFAVTLGASGEITNATGDFTLDADGLALTIGTGSAQSIEWYDGTTRKSFVNSTASGVLQLAGWDGSTVNVGIAINDSVSTLLETHLATDSGEIRLGSSSNEIPEFPWGSSISVDSHRIYKSGNYLRIGNVDFKPFPLPIFTDATRPSASSYRGGLIYNSDARSGSGGLQFADETGTWIGS